VIDLKHEIKRELNQIEPPDLWERIQADAANDGDASVLDLTSSRRRRRSLWLAVAAVLALFALVGALALLDEDQTVDTTPVTEPTTTTAPPIWSGPELDRATVVHPRTVLGADPHGDSLGWLDPTDAPLDFVDVTRVRLLEHSNDGNWTLFLAAAPPPVLDMEPEMIVAYGLVFDTNADGVADYVAGVDNDAPVRGDLRAWVTDLATGETDEKIGPPYGFPIEFSYPAETPITRRSPPGSDEPWAVLTFLNGPDYRSAPPDLDPETVRFFAWTAVTRDGVLVADDYAPDMGWMSVE